VIRARRASGAREDDILQCFIDSRYEKARRCPRWAQGPGEGRLRLGARCSRSAVHLRRMALLWQPLGPSGVAGHALAAREGLASRSVVQAFSNGWAAFNRPQPGTEGAAGDCSGAAARLGLPESARARRQVYGGRALTDDEITGLLIATLFAGQHTSSITSAWTGYLMIANKARRRARALPAARRASRPCIELVDLGCSRGPPRGSAKHFGRMCP
jgi:hypothetical protein